MSVKVFAEIIHFNPSTYRETVTSRRFIGEYENDIEASAARAQLLPGEVFCTQSVSQTEHDEYDYNEDQLEHDLQKAGF